MADPKVLQVQQWLLDTYGNRTEFSEFVSRSGFTANGNTGNNTMTSLIFALQYELGISGPTGNFGPTTINLSPAIQLSNAHTFSENIIKILEGGLWCHGYSAGYSESDDRFGGTYDADTDKAVKQLQADIGIGESGRFDGYLWKALLSTDPFVTTWTNGSSELREAQQYLNSLAINGYYFADDYLGQYIPTDGLNSRTFSNALILYIQAIQGISAPQAT
ncbi:peptidoglycan-binding protein [Erysipelothrix anatis]|uniref:peptidoglycan-binding protein n=1 Tax=Erysipelothrix anatis TaxID=2683713 RepID=UPI001409016A|nr:peptidoglycan-binding protein [Erysipelothrix anatis]